MRALGAVLLLVTAAATAASVAFAAPPKGILGTSACVDLAHDRSGATTYYVRPDGGDADHCSGRSNAPAGSDRDCAFAHPFDALPPGGPPRIRGGDRLVILPGSYRMGIGAPGTEGCSARRSYDCVMAPLPSGPSPARPTVLVGVLDTRGAPPELWGAERAWFVVNLKGTANAEVGCLEITDHSDCVEFHSGKLQCQRNEPPYGDWAATGILAVDSRHVVLRSLDIHGLASSGLTAGRVADWTLVDVFVTANGLVGWQGDLGEPSSDAGALTFRRVTFDWNGCGETARREPIGCWAEEAGGYGAGLGGASGGTWRFEDSRFLYNAGDGLDLAASVEADRVWAEGNGGSQLHLRGAAHITRSVAVGTLGGDAIRVEAGPSPVTIERSTLIGVTGALVGAVGAACRKLAPVTVERSILVGNDRAVAFYEECGGLEGAGPTFRATGNVIWQARTASCDGNLCVDPGLDPGTLSPRPGSPAAGRGARP